MGPAHHRAYRNWIILNIHIQYVGRLIPYTWPEYFFNYTSCVKKRLPTQKQQGKRQTANKTAIYRKMQPDKNKNKIRETDK